MAIEFSVDHNDTIADDNGIEPLIGWVTATVETRPGNYRVRDLGGPTPGALKINSRRGWLAANGHVYKDGTLAAPFRLVANDPAFNLRELTYRFDFDLTTLGGTPVSIPFCRGPAPGTDTTLYLARLMNDLDQPVIEVRTKGYIEDILNAGTIGQQIVVANTGEAAREAAYAASDDDFRLSDTRIPTDRSVTPAKLTAALAAVQELIGQVSEVLQLGHGTVDATQTEIWAGAVRLLFANSTGIFFDKTARIGADTDAADRALKLNSAAGQNRLVEFDTASVPRFFVGVTNDAESTGDAGSNFVIRTRHDDGSAKTEVFRINRASDVVTLLGGLVTLASTTASAGLRLPHGAAPSAPANGDFWTTTVGAFLRINGVTGQLATAADVATAIANLVNSSPATLDTLKELADALGDDPNFATTTATALGLRVLISAPVLNALPTGSGVSAAATASTLAARDANANLFADVHVPGEATITTAAGTTVLTADSPTVQRCAGTTTHNVQLPTTGITAGWPIFIPNASTGTVTVKSSDGTTLVQIAAGKFGFFWALQDTPTGSTHWGWTVPDTSGSRSNTTVVRDTNTNIAIGGYYIPPNTVISAGGTTTIAINSGSVTDVTGSANQTVKLPTSSVFLGAIWTVASHTSGTVTVTASDGSTITTLANGNMLNFQALQATPTASTHWRSF